MSDFWEDEYDEYDEEWDEEDTMLGYSDQPVFCACGSCEFYFVTADDTVPVFHINSIGFPVGRNSHPRCANCHLDYPMAVILGEEEDGELAVTLCTSDDLIHPDDQWKGSPEYN